MQILISVIVLIFGVALVIVGIVYQTLDKYRFYIQRQWPALEPLIGEWIDSACADSSAAPGFGEALEEYRAAKKPEKKIIAFMRLPGLCERTEERRGIERRLTDAAARYNEYVRVYNKRFDTAFFGKIGSVLRFVRMRAIVFD